jgi:hypothetical protein
VTSCKQGIRQATGPPSAKAKLEALCEKAGSSNPAVVHEAARELCVDYVNGLGLSGAAKERELALCKRT